MNTKLRRRTVDAFLTLLLLLQMAYILVGKELHEWLGIILFLLFLMHLYENKRWIASFRKGKCTPVQIVQTMVNILLFVCMFLLIISGILISRYVFSSISFSGSISVARTLHMLSSYWFFILISIHIGLHWRMLFQKIRKKIRFMANAGKFTFHSISVLFLLYGGYCFSQQNILSYLLGKHTFAFFDTSLPLVLFILQYLAIMWTFILTTYYLGEVLQRKNRKYK